MGSSRTASTVAVLSLVALALAGCSDDSPPSPMPTQSSDSTGSATATPSPSPSTAGPSASPSATPTVTVTASVPAGFSTDEVSSPTYPNLGGNLGAIGRVRVGRHTGFDRVVWQFAGSGRPTFQVHYVDQPTADGSGDVVKVRGAAYLEVMITSVGIPRDGTPRPANASAASIAGTVIAEARGVYGGFEAVGQTFVGVRDEKRPFRVTVLTKPTRLVVDVYSG